jgi:hypothetical protein
LEWLGHVIRINQSKVAKYISESKPEGTKKVGKPTPRWKDEKNNL